MIDQETIRSRSNPAIKRSREVRAGKVPDRVLLEGERLVADAVASGLELELILVAEDYTPAPALAAHPALRRATTEVIEAASDLRTPPGVLAIAQAPRLRPVAELTVDASTLVVVVAGIADPGNLGACARVAEAAGASALGFCGAGASPTGSKALRGSMGSLLRLPLLQVTSPDELAGRGLRQVRAATRGGQDYRSYDWRGPVALWLSGETGEWSLDGDFDLVSIPMAGAVESLNVMAAATLLAFAAARV
ncbi:TrmH family RNA methyltransferase [Engelhardtia mirabilis]|uniref:TrmH family RNA methyltransferase n=1 Tax=Engelhardtia mirabilis TaxID=2528011 RepID=UPI003AF3E194